MAQEKWIDEKIVRGMYDPKRDGVVHFEGFISPQEVEEVMQEVRQSAHLFVKKEEKYIENNQDVALVYRGSYDLEGLDSTVFENLLRRYMEIRRSVAEYSDVPLDKGNVLEVKVIRYPVSDMGVAAHRDLSSNVNFITFFNLLGQVEFYTYKNKQGERESEYLMKAGDASIMRAPRLREPADIRPLHGIEKVREERVVLAIREIRTDLEEETNRGNWRGF